MNQKKIVEKFLGNYKEEYIKEEKIYTNQQKNVAFEDNNKRIIYTDESLQNKSDNKKISKKEALEKSEEFIVSHGFSLKDASLSFYSQKDEIHKIEYIKIINGIITETHSDPKKKSDHYYYHSKETQIRICFLHYKDVLGLINYS